MNDGTGTWPEQNAVNEWWAKHNLELKKMVTSYRIEVQQEPEPEVSRDVQIEGCTIGSSFHTDSLDNVWVNVKLPPGGSLHQMLLHPCTLVVSPTEHWDDTLAMTPPEHLGDTPESTVTLTQKELEKMHKHGSLSYTDIHPREKP